MRDRAAGGLILVLDENLSGHRIVGGLVERGIRVKPQTDLMKRGVPDEAELVELIEKSWNRIQRFAQHHPRPFVAKILADGRVEEDRRAIVDLIHLF